MPLRGQQQQFGVAIVVFCEVPQTLGHHLLEDDEQEKGFSYFDSSQYSTHSDTNELWLPLRQLLERIKVVWKAYLYGFVTLLNHLNLKPEECEKLFETYKV